MATWTTAADVTGAWIGDGEPLDDDKIDLWIGKAERLLRYRIPSLAGRITADTSGELLATTRDVVVAMVTRVFRNPEGVRQWQETTGPFTNGKTYAGDTPGGLTITDEELQRLDGMTSSTQRAFGISQLPHTSPFSPYYVDPGGLYGP